MARKCAEILESWKGRRWGVLRAGWNRAACGRVYNTRKRAEYCKRNPSGKDLKVSGAARATSITSLNIQLEWVGELEAALKALNQSNIGI